MADLQPLFKELRQVMLREAPLMKVNRNDEDTLDLIAPFSHPLKPQSPMWFGAVRLCKTYVSYHLMPVYTHPALAAAVPELLQSRMQGKSCFNFKTLGAEQRVPLASLTRQCADVYSKSC